MLMHTKDILKIDEFNFQLMVDTVTLEIGRNALLNGVEEPRPEEEHVQTLFQQEEELTVLDQVVKPENVTLKNAQVKSSDMILSKPEEHTFLIVDDCIRPFE